MIMGDSESRNWPESPGQRELSSKVEQNGESPFLVAIVSVTMHSGRQCTYDLWALEEHLEVAIRAIAHRTLWLIAISIFLVGAFWLWGEVRKARRASMASCAKCPFKQISIALHSYHDDYGCFPPAYVADETGRPIHSWRALILPYCDCQGLAKEYDFSEPWDGPHNSRLWDRAPGVMNCRPEKLPRGITHIVAITGPGTAFPGTTCTKLSDFRDGHTNSIMIVEIADSKVHWLAPIDLPASEAVRFWNSPARTSISSVEWRRPLVAFVDSTTCALGRELSPESLGAALTISGGEPVTREMLQDRGQIRQGSWIE